MGKNAQNYKQNAYYYWEIKRIIIIRRRRHFNFCLAKKAIRL